MRLLIIEDEERLQAQLASSFKQAGYIVDVASDGVDGLYFGREYPIDLAIIDLGLPNLSGIEIIKTLRAEGKDFPILILTARSMWQEKVEGLDAGADDYVTKPFQIEEIHARTNALIRRAAGQASPIISHDPIKIDTRTQEVWVKDQLIELTAFEYKMLHYFTHNSGKVISKMELTEHLYEEDADRDSNVIEVFVGRLRKKLDPDNSYSPIETLRGRGYRFKTVD
jgi:two-component system response regulator PhoP